MCIRNAEEITLTMEEWYTLFPNGSLNSYTAMNSLIDIEACVQNIAKAQEKDFRQWATSRNAEVVQQFASSQHQRSFPLLNAMISDEKNPPVFVGDDVRDSSGVCDHSDFRLRRIE